jgi:hypothetical protein
MLLEYSILGKLVVCPHSENNSMEISFFGSSTISVSVECDFENAKAILDMDITESDQGLKYSSFQVVSNIFLDPIKHGSMEVSKNSE